MKIKNTIYWSILIICLILEILIVITVYDNYSSKDNLKDYFREIENLPENDMPIYESSGLFIDSKNPKLPRILKPNHYHMRFDELLRVELLRPLEVGQSFSEAFKPLLEDRAT